MIKFILAFPFILTAIPVSAQTIELNIHQKKMAYFLNIEKTLGSEKVETDTRYYNADGEAHVILYKRKQINLPDLVITYFYEPKDSGISSIQYEWSDKSANESNAKKSPGEIASFINKYNELYEQISKVSGAGKSKGDISDLSTIETGHFRKEDSWSPNDSTQIEMYMVLSSKYEKKGISTTVPTYRIRLNISNRKKDAPSFSKPDEAKIKELDTTFKTFLTHLHSRNFEKARLSISDKVVNNITDVLLEKASQNIKTDDELIIFMTGTQMSPDGSSLLFVQYKYKSDTNMPPKELLNVMFDEKNKIIGMKPTKRL